MISTINSAVKQNDANTPYADQNLNRSATNSDSSSSAQQITSQTTPPVELSTSTERAYAAISYEVSYQLNLVFSAQGVPSTTEAAAADNLPTDTTADIVTAVATAANAIDDDDESDELLEHAHDAVDKGVSDAKNVLQSQGVLSTQVDAEMTTVQENIHSGISALTSPENSGTVVSESAFIATSSRIEDNGNIQIQTNDGDMISISFNQTQDNSALAFASTSADGSVYGTASSQSSSASYSFSIDGQLDEDEREALGKLVSDLSELSEKFFSGELNDAFEKMASLKFDTEEFSGMSIDLSRTASMMAIGAYESVKTMEAPAANDPVAMENVPATPVATAPTDTPNTIPTVTTDVVTTTSQEPTTPVVTTNSPSQTPPSTPVTTEPPAIPAANGVVTLDSLISDVRQFLENLNNLELFAKPETIAVNLFEGLNNVNGQSGQVSAVALDQFKQVLELASDDDDNEISDDHHPDDSNNDVETEESEFQAQQLI